MFITLLFGEIGPVEVLRNLYEFALDLVADDEDRVDVLPSERLNCLKSMTPGDKFDRDVVGRVSRNRLQQPDALDALCDLGDLLRINGATARSNGNAKDRTDLILVTVPWDRFSPDDGPAKRTTSLVTILHRNAGSARQVRSPTAWAGIRSTHPAMHGQPSVEFTWRIDNARADLEERWATARCAKAI